MQRTLANGSDGHDAGHAEGHKTAGLSVILQPADSLSDRTDYSAAEAPAAE